MNLIKRSICLACVACAAGLYWVEVSAEDGSDKSDIDYHALTEAYKGLGADWEAKRDFTLKAIDDRAIATGLAMDKVMAVFGDDAEIVTGALGEACTAFVYFEVQWDRPSNPIEAYGYHGWYLFIESTSRGTVKNYYLSDIHKGSSGG